MATATAAAEKISGSSPAADNRRRQKLCLYYVMSLLQWQSSGQRIFVLSARSRCVCVFIFSLVNLLFLKVGKKACRLKVAWICDFVILFFICSLY